MKTCIIQKLSVLFFLLQLCTASAQQYDPSRVHKKAVALYEQARVRAESDNYVSAAGLLQQAVEQDQNYVDAYLALGSIYTTLKNYNSSISSFESAFRLDPAYSISYKFSYAHCLAGLGRFQDALDAINELLIKAPPRNPTRMKEAEERKKNYAFAIEFEKNNPAKNYLFEPVHMSDAVNSSEPEYFPSLTIDGKELVFTRKLDGRNEDFFFCRKNEQGEWEMSMPVGGSVNTPLSEGAQQISSDGQWLVFTGCYRSDGLGGCDIYFSYKTIHGWSTPENAGAPVNTDQWDAQPCLSPDKRDLYFTSRRPGGYGGSDLYVAHRLPNGRWGEPENLGPRINTTGDEQCPFIHADNQTLYFTSAQWQGYGDDDLFFVRKQPDGSWSEPQNLGYPVNSIDREGTLFIAADGKTAYFASNRSDSRGGLDLYHFELRENIRPARTLWVKGQITDQQTKHGIACQVELTDLSTGAIINSTGSDATGAYFITLPVGKDYAFSVNKKGYLFYSGQFMLSGLTPDSVYEKNIELTPIRVNASIVLNNIFFATNKADLQPESQAELDQLVQLLISNPEIRIEISGHTDYIGKPTDNQVLSMNRAKAVVAYLIRKNIQPSRLEAKGYGAARPVADNSTEEGRAQNRRTEMKVIDR